MSEAVFSKPADVATRNYSTSMAVQSQAESFQSAAFSIATAGTYLIKHEFCMQVF